MKKVIATLSALFIICALIFTVSRCKSDPFKDVGDELSQKPLTRSGEQGWDYPVKPGMAEWNSLVTEAERIEVLQVPESVLATLPPDEAVRLCITLPAFIMFTAWNTPQDGFNVMLERYNILRHLLSREDVGSSLIEAYKDASMTGFKTLPYSNELAPLRLLYFELLLSQKEILQSLTPEEKLELMMEARTKFVEKISNEAFKSIPELLFSARIMANILDMEGYLGSTNIETTIRFIETGWFLDGVPPLDEIFISAESYINSKNSQ